MTPTPKQLNRLTESNVLAELELATDRLRAAEQGLADLLLAVHDSKHWQTLTFVQLAGVMGVSRQAVQQRVSRLLDLAVGRKRRPGPPVHPGQLSLDEKP